MADLIIIVIITPALSVTTTIRPGLVRFVIVPIAFEYRLGILCLLL